MDKVQIANLLYYDARAIIPGVDFRGSELFYDPQLKSWRIVGRFKLPKNMIASELIACFKDTNLKLIPPKTNEVVAFTVSSYYSDEHPSNR